MEQKIHPTERPRTNALFLGRWVQCIKPILQNWLHEIYDQDSVSISIIGANKCNSTNLTHLQSMLIRFIRNYGMNTNFSWYFTQIRY